MLLPLLEKQVPPDASAPRISGVVGALFGDADLLSLAILRG